MNNIKQYLKLPEMRITWIFLLLVVLVGGINAYFLQNFFWILTSSLILLSVAAMVFLNNLNAAKSNLFLRLEKGRLDNVITSIGDGIVIYDTEFKIMIFNQIAEQIFELRAPAVIGQKLSLDSIKNPAFKLLAQVIFPSLASSVIRRSDPAVFPQVADITFEDPKLELRVITNQIFDETGNVVGFIKVVRDKTRESELLKSKSEFITIAAHQLRTPLSAVSWTFESLKKEQLNESQKELVSIGSSVAANLSRIVESLLNVSKIEEGKFGYTFKVFNFIDFISSALSQADLIARQYKVELYFDGPRDEAVMVAGDQDKLSLVISNLLDNAIKYNVSNGQVVIKLDKIPNKPFVEISIKDSGIGIPEEDMNKLFSKFFRGSNVVNRETTGSGLGLYIVKNIIRRHGGEIWAESELNRGSVFHFTLPTNIEVIPPKELVYGEE